MTQGDSIIATLRAVLHKRKNEVMAVFTGSSQAGLSKIMSTAGYPMYQFAQLLDFPVLGDEYLAQLVGHYATIHRGRKPKLDDLRRMFARVGFKPALMKDLIKNMSAEGITDVDIAFRHFMEDDRQIAGWAALIDSLAPLERSVLFVIAKQLPPMGQQTLKLLIAPKQPPPTLAKIRVVIQRLRKAGIVTKEGGDGLKIDDRLLAEYLATKQHVKSRVNTRLSKAHS